MDYILVIRDYIPVIISTVFVLCFLTILPSSIQRIRSRAKQELAEIRFHRCYALDTLTSNCCCKLRQLPSQQSKSRTEQVEEPFVEAVEESDEDDDKPIDLGQLISQLEVKTTKLAQSAPSEESSKRLHKDLDQVPHVHVTQIAKIFENHDDKPVKRNKVVRRRPATEYHDSENKILAARQSVTRRPISEYFESRKLSKVDDVDDENIENLSNNHQDPKKQKRKPLSEYFEPKKVATPRKVAPKKDPPEIVKETPPPQIVANFKPVTSIDEILVEKRSDSSHPVTSIDEILDQKRFSRPLSAYSISDLLGDSLADDVYVENFFNNLVAK